MMCRISAAMGVRPTGELSERALRGVCIVERLVIHRRFGEVRGRAHPKHPDDEVRHPPGGVSEHVGLVEASAYRPSNRRRACSARLSRSAGIMPSRRISRWVETDFTSSALA